MSSKPERFKFHLLLIFPPTPAKNAYMQGTTYAERWPEGGRQERNIADSTAQGVGKSQVLLYARGEGSPTALLTLGLILASNGVGVVLYVRIMCRILKGGPFLKQCDGH